jgi:thiol:disulfide interchange protein
MKLFLRNWIYTLILFPLLSSSGTALMSESIKDRHVEAVLIAETESIQAGVPFRVGLLLKHDPGWHTYWKSSATGYATSIEWNLPEGFSAGEVEWPVPEVYQFQDWTEYVYSGETLLLMTISPPETIKGDSIQLAFSADWLMCKEACVPGGMESSITIPVTRTSPVVSALTGPVFAEHEKTFPNAPGDITVRAWNESGTIRLTIEGAELPQSAFFFNDQGLVDPASGNGQLDAAGKAIHLSLKLNEGSLLPENLTGLLKPTGTASGMNSILIDTPVLAMAPVKSETPPAFSAGILLLAFIGGLILNLMPCVFPVIGIKIMGFVNQAGESRGKIVAHGLVFSGGVLLSFWVLAAALLILRSSGNQLGWGFQLQSPAFVLALTLLLFAFALNLSGLFEVGQSAVGIGSGLTAKSGMAGSFFSGVLATVVATPCAAPFLAPALGAALTLPPLASMAVFTFIALGLSAPYLLLSAFPGLIRWMPKPGPWMETFKQFMGFLLYATVAYLLWVLAGQLTDKGGYGGFSFLKVLLSLVILAMGLWIYGRWGAFHKAKSTRYKAIAATVIMVGLSLYTGLSGTEKSIASGNQVQWQEWEPGKAAQLASQGRVVYVDYTARWCVTCQTNKAAVFSSNEVTQRMIDLDVVLLKADWTHQDERISEALAKHGRSAVPFNLVFGPGTDSPLVLPEILTPGVVLNAISTASAQ